MHSFFKIIQQCNFIAKLAQVIAIPRSYIGKANNDIIFAVISLKDHYVVVPAMGNKAVSFPPQSRKLVVYFVKKAFTIHERKSSF
jgi:hypothetical protein